MRRGKSNRWRHFDRTWLWSAKRHLPIAPTLRLVHGPIRIANPQLRRGAIAQVGGGADRQRCLHAEVAKRPGGRFKFCTPLFGTLQRNA